MAQTKPQQYTPAPTGDATVDKLQDVVRQTTESVRNGPPNQTTVKTLIKNKPDQGVVFRPGQTVDVPHNLGRIPNGFNIAKVLTNTPLASSAPAAVPKWSAPASCTTRAASSRYPHPRSLPTRGREMQSGFRR